MTRSKLACAFIAATMTTLGIAASIANSGGPTNFNLGIGTNANGPFKSKVIDPDGFNANPQKQTLEVKDGRIAKFFIRLKNTDVNDDGTYVTATSGSGEFPVQYKVEGVDFTANIADPECDQFILNGGDSVIISMKVSPNGVDPGDSKTFGVSTVDSDCANREDRVFGRVKIKAG